MSRKHVLSEANAEFIKKHFGTLGAKKLAEQFGVCTFTIYQYLNDRHKGSVKREVPTTNHGPTEQVTINGLIVELNKRIEQIEKLAEINEDLTRENEALKQELIDLRHSFNVVAAGNPSKLGQRANACLKNYKL